MTDIKTAVAELEASWGKGPDIHKFDYDLARYDRIIENIKPQVVVETGLLYGGSHLWFAERVPFVITVEADFHWIHDFWHNRWELGEPPSNGVVIYGNSLERVDEVEYWVRSQTLRAEVDPSAPVLVSLDSNHDTATVYGEMCLYDKLVTPGSYMVVEDSLLGYTPLNWFNGSPREAIDRYMAEHGDEWELDVALEEMSPTTQNPGGWLRKR